MVVNETPSRIAVLGALSVGTLLLAFGHHLPFYRLHYALFPQFRVPVRLLFFWSVGVAVLGAIGLEVVLRQAAASLHQPSRVLSWLPCVWLVLTAIVGVMVVVDTGGSDGQDGTFLGTPLWLAGVSMATMLAIGILSRFSRPRVIGGVVLGLVALEGTVFTRRMITLNSPVDVGVVQ